MHLKPAELPEEVASIAAFSHAVECIYDCTLDPTRWPEAIREVCEATSCWAGVIHVSDLNQGYGLCLRSSCFFHPLCYTSLLGTIQHFVTQFQRQHRGIGFHCGMRMMKQ
jgi:hypothetical protein